jgi:hypothetical protein
MKTFTRKNRAGIALVLAGAAGVLQAAGPLYLTEDNPPVPLRWDTSGSAIPVWTDGGEAFTFDFDGVTPFITIDRANELTQHAIDQWNGVSTSTFEAELAGTIESQTGVADVTGANVADFIGQRKGDGFWVLYDTDGSIMEEFFGIPYYAVLGIAFPEFAVDGEIVEAKVILNGWPVASWDPEANFYSGVFTHEFGHAINLSHSQTNGHLAQMSWNYNLLYPGVPGCVDPVVNRDDWAPPPDAIIADPAITEVMFPFIDVYSDAGQEQGILNNPDDRAAISDLYPTPDYFSSRGSIEGRLFLKDGKTEYSGINVIARNVADPLNDAISGMTGAWTQGQLGPDGRFRINNLTPGEEYVVHIEEITQGGYPTTPQFIVSQPEYWNEGESSDPVSDQPCSVTPIVATAGQTAQADIIFNGFDRGITFTPLVDAFATALSKNGRTVGGGLNAISFLWNASRGFTVLPEEYVAPPIGAAIDRNGLRTIVETDPDGNGILEPAIWTRNGVIPLGDLNGNTCGLGSQSGISAATPWAIDQSGTTVVGLAGIDVDGDGECQGSFNGELTAFIWTEGEGMRLLDTASIDWNNTQFIRADAISGDGRVVLGRTGFSGAVAWIDEGDIIDLTAQFGAYEATAANLDGSRVAMTGNAPAGVLLWNATGDGSVRDIGGLQWCEHMPLLDWFGGDACAGLSAEEIELLQQSYGPVPVTVTDMTDDGKVLVGRAGGFFTGFAGALWIEGIGWMTWNEFFRVQGVVEASTWDFAQPLAISGSGREMVGQPGPGYPLSFFVAMPQVFVCHKGKSIQVGFPNGLISRVQQGAEVGRCEFLD